MNRFFSLIGGISLATLVASAALAEPLPTEAALADRVLGNADAKVTIIEYASLTCPHCANFHKDTLPQVEKDWIETGKARLIYRDFPTSPTGPSFAASMIARCAPEASYFTFLGAFFRSQATWATSADPVGALTQIAQLGGMSRGDVDACLKNADLLDGIRERALDGQTEYKIDSTPSFVINGKVVGGEMRYEDFAKLLEEASK